MDCKKLKIAYIGGGSKEWARVFMNDITLAKGLGGTIALYDIDRQMAQYNATIGEKLCRQKNANSVWNYCVCDTLQQALQFADFVIISILPATFKEMHSDVHAGEQYGIFQSVGDTVGIGGVVRSMRTVPLFLDFAQNIKEYCPNAWVINLTNPMTICVQALYSAFPKIKAFGCCHEVFHTQDLLAEMLRQLRGIETTRHHLHTEVSGINHFCWLTEAKYGKIDLLGLIDEFIDQHPQGFWMKNTDEYRNSPFSCCNLVKFDLFKKYGLLPTGGDRHIAEFVGGDYLSSKEAVSRWGFWLTTVDYREKRQKERVAQTIAIAEGKTTIKLAPSDEEVVNMIQALLGMGDLTTNVNLPNTIAIKQLPTGSVVESNAYFSKDSIRPIATNALPNDIFKLVERNSNNIDRCLKAILDKDLTALLEVFCDQPTSNFSSRQQAKELFDKMIANTLPYLDYFFTN